ncbi:hypothetical protein CDAR_579261 [Caerostris darwini]|uniref:Uncharacterized protein n=1 Tax=Caerostris darwini TaxID=1538125 RepID=A0AAV4SKL4_9ARAC|nr:hypothetical protein CDAR_579261 [Caerostris darwini]
MTYFLSYCPTKIVSGRSHIMSSPPQTRSKGYTLFAGSINQRRLSCLIIILRLQLADGPPLETPSLIFPSLREASSLLNSALPLYRLRTDDSISRDVSWPPKLNGKISGTIQQKEEKCSLYSQKYEKQEHLGTSSSTSFTRAMEPLRSIRPGSLEEIHLANADTLRRTEIILSMTVHCGMTMRKKHFPKDHKNVALGLLLANKISKIGLEQIMRQKLQAALHPSEEED